MKSFFKYLQIYLIFDIIIHTYICNHIIISIKYKNTFIVFDIIYFIVILLGSRLKIFKLSFSKFYTNNGTRKKLIFDV